MEFVNNIFKITKGKKVISYSDKPSGYSHRYLQIEDLRNNSQLKYANNIKSVYVDENDIIIAWDGANVGTIGFRHNGIIGSTLARLSIKEEFIKKCNSIYLGYFLSSKFEYFQKTSTGATIPHLSRSALERLQIPLPNLETQNKIVAILDKIKTILNKRKETIVKYEGLLGAVFLDTFGSPMERPNQWKLHAIGEGLNNLYSGSSYGGEENKQLEDDELGVLKVSAVTRGFFNANEFKAVKKDIIKRQIIHPKKGDLLFSRANTLELVGATCIVDADYNNLFLPDKIWKVETDEAILKKTYLHYVLQNKDVRKTFLSIATGSSGSMLNISMDKFRNIIIPYPPIELQEKFEKAYLKYTGFKVVLKMSHQHISDLFGSISQLAFKGELDFNTAVDLELLLENDYAFFKKNSNQETIKLLLRRLDKDELNDNRFYDQGLYDKAKEFVFELLKEHKIKQVFDSGSKRIKLII